MKPFPGKLVRKANGFVFSPKQMRWLEDVYPTHTNIEISKAIGISYWTLRSITRRKSIDLKKDRDWLVYERCKQMRKEPFGCAQEHYMSIQKRNTITIATKVSMEDYIILREAAKKAKQTKYEFIQNAIRKYIKEQNN